VSGYDIDISVRDSSVTARGMVDTELQKETVLSVLRTISGVREVKLEVQVDPAKAGQPTVIRVPGSKPERDRELSERVRNALLADPEFRSGKVQVEVSRGIVQLHGEVANRAVILDLARRARGVSGVIAVNSAGMDTRERGSSSVERTQTAPMLRRPTAQEVRDIQLALQAIGLYKGSTDGAWNALTEKGLLAFQARYNLPITGQIDAASVSALHVNIPESRLPLAPLRPGIPGSSSLGPESLVVVMTANDIRAVQQALQALNLYRGPVNGRLEQPTRAALLAFQRSRHLVASGDIDQPTVNALGLKIDLSRKDIVQ
jgi:peptidoglycan hydrolase-like protein with peptidoglycan-binding domain